MSCIEVKIGFIIGDPTGLKEDFKRWDSTTSVSEARWWRKRFEPSNGMARTTERVRGSWSYSLRWMKAGKTPNFKHTWYIGKRSGRYSVNIDGKEHTWYSSIPTPKGDRVTFKGPNDTATYQAVNHYQIHSDRSIDTKDRSIHRLVVGDQSR